MKKSLLGFGLMLAFSIPGIAQDIHYSQYYASPLTWNPAQTGLINRDYRIAANYRTQNYQVSSNPYITGSISYDMPILQGKLPEGDALGVGAVVFYDKAGTGALQNVTGGLSFAYHKALGQDNRHMVSLGAQAMFVNKSINFSKLVFGDQLDPRMPETYLPTNENFGNQDVSYPDFNAGLMYTGKINQRSSMYAGVGYFHLTSPQEKFLEGSNSANVKLNPRYSVFVGGSTELNPNVAIFGSGLFQRQGPAQEILLGAATGFILNPEHREDVANTVLYLGLWYRLDDAIIPYIGLEWTQFQLGFSYDITVSNASRMTEGQGAYEVSLIYNGIFTKHQKQKYNFACPKF